MITEDYKLQRKNIYIHIIKKKKKKQQQWNEQIVHGATEGTPEKPARNPNNTYKNLLAEQPTYSPGEGPPQDGSGSMQKNYTVQSTHFMFHSHPHYTIQWNLIITRSEGPRKSPCHSNFSLHQGKKIRKTQRTGTNQTTCHKRVFHIRPPHNEAPLYA